MTFVILRRNSSYNVKSKSLRR